MNIGVHFNSFNKVTGIESVIINSLNEMIDMDKSNHFFSTRGTSELIDIPSISNNKILSDNYLFPSFLLRQNNIQIVHSFYPDFEYRVQGIKYVLTIHDMIPLSHPEWFPPATHVYFEGEIRKSAEMADKIIAVSQATKDDIIKFYGIPEKKIDVVYNGLNKKFSGKYKSTGIIEKYNLEAGYIASICTLEPRKNLRSLIKGFLQYKNEKPEDCSKLVVIGGKGWDDDFFSWLNSLGIHKEDIIITGYVQDDELAELYANAMAIAYVSFYEGFGLPVLEGMAAGKAVICSNTSSMPEVGGDAVCYCNPYSVDSISEAIYRVLNDVSYREDLGKRAQKRSKMFSYKNAAEQILSIYEELL